MKIDQSDAQLVAGQLAGDSAALAAIYDRYAHALHDTAAAMLNDRDDAADVMQDVFLIAASKLDQLRDPSRLKPWLFAILRNEVYRRTKQRRRTIATDFSNDDAAAASGFDMTDAHGVDADTDAVEGVELAGLVRGAARGLDERDQLVLELSVRQGLDGQDLADALGVSANQSYTLVHRMRERVERSLGAFCVAKAGRKDCSDLDSILSNWDGEFTVLVRKRVARHIESCDRCAESRRKVAPLALFGGAPVLAAPAALRDRILGAVQLQMSSFAAGGGPTTPYAFTADGGFPRLVSAGRKLAGWIAPTAAASLLLVTAGVGFWFIDVARSPDTFQSAVVTTAPVPTSTSPAASNATPTTSRTPTSIPTPTVVSAGAPTSLPADTPTTVPTASPAPVPAPTTTTTTGPTSTRPPRVQPPPAVPPPTAPRPTAPAPTAPAPVVTPVPVTTPASTPGVLTGSTPSVALGNGQATFTLTNTGGLPVNWTTNGATPYAMSASAGLLQPGASTNIVFTIDRANLPEGVGPSVVVTLSGDGGQSLQVSLSSAVDRPPVIANVNGPTVTCVRYNFGASTLTAWMAEAGAAITDESGGTATLAVSGPGGRSGTASNPISPNWFVTMNTSDSIPTSGAGAWNWNITAIDTRGNTATTSGSVNVACP